MGVRVEGGTQQKEEESCREEGEERKEAERRGGLEAFSCFI